MQAPAHDAAEQQQAKASLGSLATAPQRTVPPGYIHLGVAKGIYAVLNELGADPDEVIAESGVDPRIFGDPDNQIAVSALGRLVLHCVARTNCPHFGLLVGARATLESLRLVGMLMRCAATLGEALRLLELHLRVQNRGAVVHLERGAVVAVLSYSVYGPAGEGAIHISEGALATGIRVIRELCGAELVPGEVLIPRRPPMDPGPYRRLFRAPIRFNQERAALVFPARWLNYPIASADAATLLAVTSHVLNLQNHGEMDLGDELRRRLRMELIGTKRSASEIARGLSIHRRTLNRHLRAEGTGYKMLADEVRFAIASQLLADTDIPLAEIAAVLDFSEPAAFTRAFHRWAGRAPSSWRVDANRKKPAI